MPTQDGARAFAETLLAEGEVAYHAAEPKGAVKIKAAQLPERHERSERPETSLLPHVAMWLRESETGDGRTSVQVRLALEADPARSATPEAEGGSGATLFLRMLFLFMVAQKSRSEHGLGEVGFILENPENPKSYDPPALPICLGLAGAEGLCEPLWHEADPSRPRPDEACEKEADHAGVQPSHGQAARRRQRLWGQDRSWKDGRGPS